MRLTDIEPVFVEFIPEELEDGKLYISRAYKVAIHLCACGCKTQAITPMHGVVGNRVWKIIEDNGLVTLEGSIGHQNLPCGSHYHIRHNKIIWD